MSDDPTVEITDVKPGAVKVLASELRDGDTVFDIFGGEHTIDRVRSNTRITRFRRSDGLADYFPNTRTITIRPTSPDREDSTE